MTPSEEAELLQRCLFCGYPLRGLPVVHRCPECGQRFDRSWRLFRREQEWERASSWRWARFMLLVFVGAPAATLMALREQDQFLWGPFLAPVVWIACGAMAWRMCANSPRFVGVGRGGISVLDRRAKTQDGYLWSDVRAAGLCSEPPGFLLHLNGNNVFSDALGDDAGEVKRCVEYINKFDRRSAGSGSEPGTEDDPSHKPG